jgi:hypothetical protein
VPSRVTVVGHAFRRRRFEQLDMLAMRRSKTCFTYKGVQLWSETDKREVATGEVRLLSKSSNVFRVSPISFLAFSISQGCG